MGGLASLMPLQSFQAHKEGWAMTHLFLVAY